MHRFCSAIYHGGKMKKVSMHKVLGLKLNQRLRYQDYWLKKLISSLSENYRTKDKKITKFKTQKPSRISLSYSTISLDSPTLMKNSITLNGF
jgi:hypothetical protein